MSTRIYAAYRLREGVDLWDFLAEVKPRTQEEIRARLTDLCFHLLESPECHPDIRQVVGLCPDTAVGFYACWRYVQEKYRLQLAERGRNDYDLDVSITVRRHAGRYYLIPRADMTLRGVFDWLAGDPRLEDYRYWNSIDDRPDGVSEAEWEARRDTWHALARTGWANYLVAEILSLGQLHAVAPQPDLVRARLGSRPA